MARHWEVQRSTGQCAAAGRNLAEGEEFYTVLFEDGDSFRRVDYSLDAWDGPPEGAFCWFKSQVPKKTRKKRMFVADEMLVAFFVRLADESEPLREQFRFVLALILMRKRILRYGRTLKEAGSEVWEMVLVRDKSNHRVVNPALTDDQIDNVSRMLGEILHGDMGEFADEFADDIVDALADSDTEQPTAEQA